LSVYSEENSMAGSKHRYFSDQFEGIARELSRLSIVCDIEILEPGMAERILDNDESVCGRKNPEVFQQIRRHLMVLFPLEKRAIDRIGGGEVREILDQVRAAIVALREAGSPGNSRQSPDQG
jgi:hypothetical protein